MVPDASLVPDLLIHRLVKASLAANEPGEAPREKLAGITRLSWKLPDDLVVIGVSTDPDPVDPVGHIYAKGSIVIPNANRPDLADALK